MKTENLKFRQAIFEKGKFARWHYWRFIGYRNDFIRPIIISGIKLQYKIMDSQQYTGERDFYDKEIYEGDKITNQSRNNKDPHPIIFFKGKFLGNYGGLFYDFSQEIEIERIKVVGNIHE